MVTGSGLGVAMAPTIEISDHVAAVLGQLLWADDPETDEREHADGDLEEHAEQGEDHDREPVVILRAHEDVERLAVERLQEADGAGQGSEVPRRSRRRRTGRAQSATAEARRGAPLARAERRQDERGKPDRG